MADDHPLTAPIAGATRVDFVGMTIDLAPAGDARVKRMIYPAGGRWSTHIKPHVGTEWCEHAHVGFLAQGRLSGEYPDGCTFDYSAPAVVCIEPGHDSWVGEDVDAVLIEIDFTEETPARLGMPTSHRH